MIYEVTCLDYQVQYNGLTRRVWYPGIVGTDRRSRLVWMDFKEEHGAGEDLRKKKMFASFHSKIIASVHKQHRLCCISENRGMCTRDENARMRRI